MSKRNISNRATSDATTAEEVVDLKRNKNIDGVSSSTDLTVASNQHQLALVSPTSNALIPVNHVSRKQPF